MDELKQFLENHRMPHRSMRLLTASDALNFVQLCKGKRVKLGGFDGFHILPGGVRIDQEFSPDYSKYSTNEALELASAFFEAYTDDTENIGYEMVVVETASSN